MVNGLLGLRLSAGGSIMGQAPQGFDFLHWVRMRTLSLMALNEPPMKVIELARWTGKDKSQVSRFLRGKEGWPLKDMPRLAAAFGLTVGEFLEPLVNKSQ